MAVFAKSLSQENTVRYIYGDLFFGTPRIEDLELDPNSRDDIPRLLMGLYHLWVCVDVRLEVLEHIRYRYSLRVDVANGRPGLSFWQVLVLGILKQGLNCDYDRLAEYAKKHEDIRIMLQMSPRDCAKLSASKIAHNVKLVLDEEGLRFVNEVIVDLCHEQVGREEDEPLELKADSYVVETDVKYPIDYGLLRDAMNAALREVGKLFRKLGLHGWRQHRYLCSKLRKLIQLVSRKRKNSPGFVNAVSALLDFANKQLGKVRTSLETLPQGSDVDVLTVHITMFCDYAELLSDQVRRRLLEEEKIFSVFEPHTRWISKGKKGRPVELGVPVCVTEDQHRFIVDWDIMWKGGDRDVIFGAVDRVAAAFGSIGSLSLDKGFWSPAVLTGLQERMDLVVLPKMGRRNKADTARESDEEFGEGRRKHPAIESAINELEQHGLSRIYSYGADGFALMTGLGICATNLTRLGRKMLDEEAALRRKRRRRRR